ncbi:hypothetical protein ACFP1I_22195 [Dyadobacter subterraneus]|uniref:Uncharacterized protein n=1 Tax=Dyadobacter subterraneus TaxID=2773304 RepID=A0ABR9WJA2_9BACT|nr:hypothetical protein [Dyadobacter subterraneus]MBE9465520.1 hypothetical protein [Dyadobacter subterraneus]
MESKENPIADRIRLLQAKITQNLDSEVKPRKDVIKSDPKEEKEEGNWNDWDDWNIRNWGDYDSNQNLDG